jgi:hypothetical protein
MNEFLPSSSGVMAKKGRLSAWSMVMRSSARHLSRPSRSSRNRVLTRPPSSPMIFCRVKTAVSESASEEGKKSERKTNLQRLHGRDKLLALF